MPAEKKTAEPFKHWFNAELYRQLADTLADLAPRFDRKRFLALCLEGLDERELMDRLRQTAIAFDASLPGTYRDKLEVALAFAPRIPRGFVTLSLCDFVARHGLNDFDRSLEALRFLTSFGSAEFAVRPFILKDPDRALATLLTWTRSPDEHVRRLASEGSRPRLPWGLRLTPVIANPDLTAPILDALKADPALYVRKSVANHLNDISKDHPAWVLAKLKSWDRSDPGTRWIVQHALRTLVKKGHPEALLFFGARADDVSAITVKRFAVSPKRLRLGETLSLEAELRTDRKKSLKLVVDYVIHYPKASGKTSIKVFKWASAEFNAGEPLRLSKSQRIRDFTIRKHHPGKHAVELQINGHRVAKTAFVLA